VALAGNGLAKRHSQLLLAMNVFAFVCALNGKYTTQKWVEQVILG